MRPIRLGIVRLVGWVTIGYENAGMGFDELLVSIRLICDLICQ